MHEFSLYGRVAECDHFRLLQQLAGVARMQPKPIEELHLVFKAQPPPGLSNIPSTGEASTKQDVQRISKMLTSNIYMVQIVGDIQAIKKSSVNGGGRMTNGDRSEADQQRQAPWTFEFKDIPDPGKQAVNGRLVSRTAIEDGNIIKFMEQFGYEYVNRYVVKGDRLYDQDTTLSLHRLYKAPSVSAEEALDWSFMNQERGLELFDTSGEYLLQASVEAVDGSVSELKDRASSQLLAMRDVLKQVVTLAPADRLSLDTRVPVR